MTIDPAADDAVARRGTCRGFLPDPVPRATLETLLARAQRAPSWCNTQPWEVHVTEGAGTERFRTALRQHAQSAPSAFEPDLPMPAEYHGVHLDRRREVGWQLYQAVGVARGDREGSARESLRNFELFGAPHALVITVDRSQGHYGVLDTGVYVGTLLVVAESLGLGAAPQAALAVHAPLVRRFFDIADDRAVVLGVSLGYPDPDHPANSFRTRRAPLDEVVSWTTS